MLRHTSTITPTNLIIRFESAGLIVSGHPMKGMARESVEYAENNEDLILTPDREEILYNRSISIVFTPVSFMNQQKGFKITKTISAHKGNEAIIVSISYIILSDMPMEVSEDDVEMIMENGEWVKYERAITVESPNNEEPNTIMQGATTETGQPVVTIAKPVEVQQSLSKEEVLVEENIDVTVLGEEPIAPIVISSNTSHFWFYVGTLLVFCFCVVLYFVRKR